MVVKVVGESMVVLVVLLVVMLMMKLVVVQMGLPARVPMEMLAIGLVGQ